MTHRKWTQQEDNYLKMHYGKMSNKQLAKDMDRTKQGLQHRAYRLKLTTKLVATWKHCIDCGVKLSRAATYRNNVCRCFPCSMKHHSNENHHNWKGGVASLRSTVQCFLKHAWIDKIFVRDNFTCALCDKRGGNLEVHHIRPYSKIRDDIIKLNPDLDLNDFEDKKKLARLIVEDHVLEDGITLCINCHYNLHHLNQGELTGNSSIEDNQQPSLGSNTLEGSTTRLRLLSGKTEESNEPTSALDAYPLSAKI